MCFNASKVLLKFWLNLVEDNLTSVLYNTDSANISCIVSDVKVSNSKCEGYEPGELTTTAPVKIALEYS